MRIAAALVMDEWKRFLWGTNSSEHWMAGITFVQHLAKMLRRSDASVTFDPSRVRDRAKAGKGGLTSAKYKVV